jgi:hypothetical protein
MRRITGWMVPLCTAMSTTSHRIPRTTAGSGAAAPADTDLSAWLSAFTASMSSAQPYREPTAPEAAGAVAALRRLLGDGDATALLGPLGFTVTSGLDSASGRPFVLAFSESSPGDRAWAAVLVDRSMPVGTVIGCPHPVFDKRSEQLGLALWQRIPGALLLVAGAHRDAAAGLADPRNHPESLFHRLSTALLDAGLPHVQIHGFADASAPGFDVVLSPGPTTVGIPILRAADSLTAHGLVVARGWETPVPGLDGSTNIQGRAADTAGAIFVHVEVSATARADAGRREQVIDALVGTDLAGTGWPGPILAQAVAGQFPVAVGTANTAGASPYGARADHRHAERQATLDRITALESDRQHAHAAADLSSGRLDPARLPLADSPTILDYAAAITIDHSTGRSFAVTATGALAVTMSAAAVPADGATVLLEVYAGGATSSVTFPSPTTRLSGLPSPFVVAAGKLGLFGLRYSARAGHWVVTSAGVEQ